MVKCTKKEIRRLKTALRWKGHPQQRRRIELVKSVPDGRERKPGNLGNRRLAAPARRTRLGAGKQPLATLVKLRANKLPAQPNPLLVDHPNADTAAARRWESHRPESHQRRVEHQSIQLF